MTTLGRWPDIIILYFTTPFPGPFSQQKCYKMLYGTQIWRDNLLFMMTIDPLLSFLLYMVGSRRIFSFNHFNILCLWLNWYCANKWPFFHSPQKQMFTLDKSLRQQATEMVTSLWAQDSHGGNECSSAACQSACLELSFYIHGIQYSFTDGSKDRTWVTTHVH